MTLSVIAQDKKTGDFGVAVASHWFNAGYEVPTIESGVGAVIMQAVADSTLGLSILSDLRGGKSARDILALLQKNDPVMDSRQIAIIDNQGNVVAHTGQNCIQSASHALGQGFSVQANMMSNDQIVPAMKKAFETASSQPFVDRLITCLEAGEKAGGDLRGRQAAGLIVVPAKPNLPVLIHLQVPDHPEPLKELKRLLFLDKAYKLMNEGDMAMAKEDKQTAISLYQAALELVPDNVECRYMYGITLLNCGNIQEGKRILAQAYAHGKKWQELTERLVKSGLVEKSAVV